MTTNVCSFIPNSKIFACDSRWSYETDKFFYFIDDSGYDKICHTKKFVAVFAGNSYVIEKFKNWINDGCPKDAMPSPNEISIIVYNLVNGKHFARNHSFTLLSGNNIDVLFSGSGSFDAIRSWKTHKCAEQAVRDACITDLYTGGTVKFFNLQSHQHNIQANQLPYSQLFKILSTEGFVMNKQTQPLNTATAYPIKDVISNPEIAQDLFALQSGKASLNAPAPEAEIEWSEQEIQDLSDFFQQCK